jgi:hypothetical protein
MSAISHDFEASMLTRLKERTLLDCVVLWANGSAGCGSEFWMARWARICDRVDTNPGLR